MRSYVRVHRIGVEERRARLVRRHRLAPADRAHDPLDGRALARLPARDRRGHGLPLDPGAQRRRRAGATSSARSTTSGASCACSRCGGRSGRSRASSSRSCSRPRRRRSRRRSGSGSRASSATAASRPGPAPGSRAPGNAALAAVAARGEAMTTRDRRATCRCWRRSSASAPGKWVVEQSAGARVLPQLAMEGRLVRGRPRGTWISPQFRWVTTEDWLGGPIEELDVAAAQAELLRRWLAAFGPATETDMRWWTGWTARETRAALAAIPHAEVDLDGATGYVLAGRPRADASPPSRPPRCCPRSTRRRWAGRSATGTSARTAPTLFDSNGNAGPTSGGTAASSAAGAQRRDGEIVARPARGRRPRRARGDRRRGRAPSAPGSATSASRPASCRPSSAASAEA